MRTRQLWYSLALLLVAFTAPPPLSAAPYFEDGFLGLTQQELHQRLGMPQAVRDRKSALRVFTYYPITDWQKYFSKLVSPENGEDVYTFTRNGVEVRYSFSYMVDPNDTRDDRPLFVRLVDVEFSPPIPIAQVPAMVPEFRPSQAVDAPAFRSNIWLLLFKGPPSPEARFLIREHGKEQLEWTLAYQLFSLQGLPDRLTTAATVDRMEIGVQSVSLIKQRLRHTHEPVMNPYSPEFAVQAQSPQLKQKPVPVPRYAE